jgi:AcrR family transcriptional regulator
MGAVEAATEVAAAATERGRRTRERILRAAVELFAEHGYGGVTMRMLGDAAGLDNSSLYRHFPDKRSLAAAALDSAAAELLDLVQPLRETEGNFLDALVATVVDLGDHLAERPALARLLLEWILTRDRGASLPILYADEVERPAVQLLTALADALARARRTGAIRRVDVLEALANVVAVLLLRPATTGTWLADLDGSRGPEARRRARRRELEAFLRGALAPAESS